MTYPRLLPNILTLLTITAFTWSCDPKPQQQDYITAIEESVSKLSEDRFHGDSTLIQTFDPLTGETDYMAHNDGLVLFSRISNDTGIPVIVLREHEDNLEHKGKDKHVFIALRSKLDDDQVYYPLYTYVIELNDCPGTNLKDAYRLEFDIWNGGRSIEVYGRSVGWTSCKETIFVPCKRSLRNPVLEETGSASDELPKVDQTKSSFVKTPKWGLNIIVTPKASTNPFNKSAVGQGSWKNYTSNTAATVAGGDFTNTLDFFADLIPPVKKARAITSSVISGAPSAGANLNIDLDDADMFQRKGWRTESGSVQGRGITVALPFESESFVGFGSCPYIKVDEFQLDELVTTADYINFYLSALRNQCQQKHVSQIHSLFQRGYLIVQNDKTLIVPTDLPIMKEAKLTKQETIDFSKAAEFAFFSQVFLAELRQPAPVPQLPDGELISHTVFTMLRFILHTMDQARKSPNHFILLSRNMINTILSSRTKALQDFEQIHACAPCTPLEKQKSFAEILTFESAKRFISSTHPIKVIQETFDPFEQFEKFYKQNKQALVNETKLLCGC